jgi:hypothetical protein
MTLGSSVAPRFSVAVPVFNHERFVGETVASAFGQDYEGLEVLISDNASTDRSREVAVAASGGRAIVASNATNIGFAANLDRAVALGTAPFVMLVSSDDRMQPNALSTYAHLLDEVDDPGRVILTAASWRIDEHGEVTGRIGRDERMWAGASLDAGLSQTVGHDVWSIGAGDLLAASLRYFRNPASFVSTCYPRSVWEAVGGYRGARLANPDKWFLWRALTQVDRVLFVDEPLFDYRRHSSNVAKSRWMAQSLTQAVDDYCSLLELTEEMLAFAGVDQDAVEQAFLNEAVLKRAAVFAADGRSSEAVTYRRFAAAVAGGRGVRNRWWWFAGALTIPGVHRLVPRRFVDGRVGDSLLHGDRPVTAQQRAT